LEITESAFAKDPEQIISQVKRLIDYGFTIEIDDFGSGYSSLNTLKDVPADILKLDMRFLEGGEDTPRSGKILESIVAMATKLGMTVIAEGVEHKWQADYLVSIGCRYIQGFYYYSPMPLGRYEELLVNNRPSKQPRGQTEIN
jgi:EAL domain-containing protein (putative c-di-GMP-specific phosphodiesterase class I)